MVWIFKVRILVVRSNDDLVRSCENIIIPKDFDMLEVESQMSVSFNIAVVLLLDAL